MILLSYVLEWIIIIYHCILYLDFDDGLAIPDDYGPA